MLPFVFLSVVEFEALSPGTQLTYLSDAMEELERLKMPREARGWDTLFTQAPIQQQQQGQSKDGQDIK